MTDSGERYKHKTMSDYLRALRHLEREEVNLDDKESFREWVLKQRSKGTLERTLNAYIKPYNSYIAFLGEQKFKPFKNQKSIKRTRATMNYYEKLVAACRVYTALRDRLVVEILFKTGLRYIEVMMLTIDDFNLQTNRIIVRAGKNEKYREVSLFPSVREAFLKYLLFRQTLIVNQDGRHLWENGFKPELIQQLLGHTSIGTTMIHIQPDAENAFSEVSRNMKKLDFNDSHRRGQKETVGCNLDHIICSGRDLDPSRGIESP